MSTQGKWQLEQWGISNSDRASRNVGASLVEPGSSVQTTLILIVNGEFPKHQPRAVTGGHLLSGVMFTWSEPADMFPMILTITIDGSRYASDYYAPNGDPETHEGEVIDYLTHGSTEVERRYNIPFAIWLGGESTDFTLGFTAIFHRGSLGKNDEDLIYKIASALTWLLEKIFEPPFWLALLLGMIVMIIILKVLGVFP